VSLAGGTVQKPPGLAPPKAVVLSQPHLVAVVPSYSLPLTPVSVTRTDLVVTVWALVYGVSKVGKNRKDALELKMLSRDRNELK